MKTSNFSVRLINADTGKPFKEHVRDDGEVFAEVEPNAFFWVELEVVGGVEDMVYYFQTFIDGNKLEQYFWSKKNYGPHLEGLSSFQNGVWTKKSFRFHVPEFNHDRSSSTSASAALMGKVTVQISKAIHVTTTDDDFVGGMSQQETQVTVNDGGLENKTLRTVPGKKHDSTPPKNVMEASAPKDTWEVYVDGELVEEITINYCTALGLIHAGILPKPPVWDYHRLRYALSDEDKENTAHPEYPCEKVVAPATYGPDGKVLVAEKDYEVFDLTGDESDHDDEMESEETDNSSIEEETTGDESDDGGEIEVEGTAKSSIEEEKAKPKPSGGVGGAHRGDILEEL